MNPGLCCLFFMERLRKEETCQAQRIWHYSKLKHLSAFPWMDGTGYRGKNVPRFPSLDSFAGSLDSVASLFCPPKHRHKMGLGEREQYSCFSAGTLDFCLCCSLSHFRWQMAPLALPLVCPLLGPVEGPQLSSSYCLPTVRPAMPLRWLYQNWMSSERDRWLPLRPHSRHRTGGLTCEKFRIKIFYYLANGCCFIHLTFPS